MNVKIEELHVWRYVGDSFFVARSATACDEQKEHMIQLDKESLSIEFQTGVLHESDGQSYLILC